MKGIRSFFALLALVLLIAACGTPDTAQAPAISDGLPLAPEGMEDVTDEPPFIEGEPREGFMLEEVLASDATGILEVRAFVFEDADGPRLCSVMAASLPPLCGGEKVTLVNIDALDASLFEESQGIRWTNQYVTLRGEFIDGEFMIHPLAAG